MLMLYREISKLVTTARMVKRLRWLPMKGISMPQVTMLS